MKQLKIGVILIFSLLILGCSQQGGEPVLHDLDNKPVQLSKLKGKWVIVNYWASWCHNCADEMPELNNFYKHNTDKNILLYGTNVDDIPPDELKEAVHNMDINFPILVEDPLHAWNLDDVEGVPMTFIINPKGEVVKKILGTNTEQSLKEMLQELKKDEKA